MEPARRKDAVRRLALLARNRLPEADRAAAGAAASQRLLSLEEVRRPGPVLAFVPIGREIPISPFLEAVLGRGRELWLPFVAEDGAMRAAPVASLEELEPGYRRIPEPRARLPVDPARAAVVVTPGVAFDQTGGRLGYGGGFYDRFLGAVPPSIPRIGVCFEAQMVEQVPTEPTDEPVHLVVTEQRVIRARA